VLAIGEIGEPVCQIPVDMNRVGMILYGGAQPRCCAHEAGIEVENRAMSTVMEYQELQNFWNSARTDKQQRTCFTTLIHERGGTFYGKG